VIILNTREIGNKYEDKSVEILIKNSYKILERNYQNKYGEIDIIAQKDDEIVFIEVKYRKTNKFGYGYEAVDRKKLFKIVKLAQLYMQSKKYEKYKMRFDCMSYLEDELDWIKNIVDMNTPLFVKKILKRKRIKADIGGSCCCITSDIHIFVFILNTNTLFD